MSKTIKARVVAERLENLGKTIRANARSSTDIFNDMFLGEHKNCATCNNTGKVEEGEHDDIREVDCPDCTDFEDPDFSGATEGDR